MKLTSKNGKDIIEGDVETRNQHGVLLARTWFCESQSYSFGGYTSNDIANFKTRWEEFERNYAGPQDIVLMI